MKKYIILALMFFTLITVDKTYAINYVDVQSFNDIPLAFGDLKNANDPSVVGFVNFETTAGGHFVRITHPNGTVYRIATSGGNPAVVELPGVDVLEGSLILNSGKYYVENGNRHLYYEFQNAASSGSFNASIFDGIGNLEKNGFRPMVIWNLTTGEYDITDKLELFGVVYKGPFKNAYIDILFPMDVDYILSIQFEWYYRYKGLFGGYTEWEYSNQVRIRGEEHHFVSPGIRGFYRAVSWLLPMLRPVSQALENLKLDSLNKIGNVTPEYMANYLNKVNTKLAADDKPTVVLNDLFSGDFSIHRVFLDNYTKGLYTDYQIRDDIVLLDLQYVYRGELFHPVITDIEWTPVSIDTASPGVMSSLSNSFHLLFGGIWDWIKSWAGPAAIIIAIILLFPIAWGIIRIIIRIWKAVFPQKRKYRY